MKKFRCEKFADGGMPEMSNQGMPQSNMQNSTMRSRPLIGYGRPGDPSMYGGSGIKPINTSLQISPSQPQQQQIPDPCKKW